MTKKRRDKRKRLRDFANGLNRNLPKSERWFHKLYKPYQVQSDVMNGPFCGFIPDLRNKQFKYIVEVDGSMHNLERVKRQDEKKNAVFTREGYTVIRVKAYSFRSFQDCMRLIQTLRREEPTFKIKRKKTYCEKHPPKPFHPKVFVRRKEAQDKPKAQETCGAGPNVPVGLGG